MGHRTEIKMPAATEDVARPPHRLVGAFLDSRLSARSLTRALADPEFRVVVAGLVAALASHNPTLAHRALIALASLGPPIISPLLDYINARVSRHHHRSLVTALAIAALRADAETRFAVQAALASRAGKENPPSPLWIAYHGTLAWMDAHEG
jgi:hypothetical protein